MKTVRGLASFLLLASLVCAAPARAQEFLNPVEEQPAVFLSNNAANAAMAAGGVNHDSNLLTGPGAFKLPTPRQFSLPRAQTALLAAPGRSIPSGAYSFGFSRGSRPSAGARYALPPVSTSSVDLNIVDCPYLVENTPVGAYNPYSVNNNMPLPTRPDGTPISFQESAAAAAYFLQQANLDSQQQY